MDIRRTSRSRAPCARERVRNEGATEPYHPWSEAVSEDEVRLTSQPSRLVRHSSLCGQAPPRPSVPRCHSTRRQSAPCAALSVDPAHRGVPRSGCPPSQDPRWPAIWDGPAHGDGRTDGHACRHGHGVVAAERYLRAPRCAPDYGVGITARRGGLLAMGLSTRSASYVFAWIMLGLAGAACDDTGADRGNRNRRRESTQGARCPDPGRWVDIDHRVAADRNTSAQWGWRTTTLVYAALMLLVCTPLHWTTLARRPVENLRRRRLPNPHPLTGHASSCSP